jgi:hypothetical protein
MIPKGTETSRKRMTFMKAGHRNGSVKTVLKFSNPAVKKTGRPPMKPENIKRNE